MSGGSRRSRSTNRPAPRIILAPGTPGPLEESLHRDFVREHTITPLTRQETSVRRTLFANLPNDEALQENIVESVQLPQAVYGPSTSGTTSCITARRQLQSPASSTPSPCQPPKRRRTLTIMSQSRSNSRSPRRNPTPQQTPPAQDNTERLAELMAQLTQQVTNMATAAAQPQVQVLQQPAQCPTGEPPEDPNFNWPALIQPVTTSFPPGSTGRVQRMATALLSKLPLLTGRDHHEIAFLLTVLSDYRNLPEEIAKAAYQRLSILYLAVFHGWSNAIAASGSASACAAALPPGFQLQSARRPTYRTGPAPPQRNSNRGGRRNNPTAPKNQVTQ